MKFLFALTSLLFGYAASEDTGSAANGTVVDVALSDPDTFSSLVDFVVLADLADALATTEGITVFAPINDAFAALTAAAPDVVANLQTEQWNSHLQNVLLYHVLADEVPSSAVTDGLTVTTLNGEDIAFTVNDDGIFVNSNSQVVAADVDASNGVIHAIDGVLLPSWVSNTIIDIAQNTEDLSNLVSLILFANPAIVEVLDSPGGYTVFAPSNLSWQALFDQFDVNAATLALLDQQEGILTTALKYHVVDGVYGTGDIVDGLEVTTLQGETLTLSLSNDTASGFTVNGLEILSSDILANNGVVHVIEGVLVPQELTDTDESGVIVPDSVSNATESEPSESSDEPVVEEPTNTVVDVALSDPDTFSSLVDFVVLADLADALATTEGITVFAPINDAFAALTAAAPDVVANLQTEQWNSHLQNVLLYHVLADEVPSSAVTDGLTVTTLNGEDIAFTVNDDGIFVNSNSQVVAADVDASNGVIHAIDGVLLPSWVSNTIIDIAQNTEDLSNLVSLILFANPAIVEVLDSPGGYTVFAPSNLSWQALFDQFDVNAATLALLDQQEGILTTALKHHVVDGVYGTGDIVDGLEVTTLQGETLTLSLSNDTASGFTVNGLEILSSDILANNGVVHVIEGVLVPQELTDTDESGVIVPDSVSNATESEPSESSDEPVVEEPTNTVVDVALSDPDTFSSLVDFVVLADLADALATTEGITVFAPINDAFAALTAAAPDVVANLQTEQWNSHLQNVLLYHVLADEVPSSAVTDGLTVTTLNGEDIAFTVNDDGIFVNSNSQVVAADVDASNGVIHAIDGVLLPSWVSNTIIDIAQNTEDLSNLVSLILFANPAIVEVLDSPGGYTVFAPSNLSWQALFDQFDVNAATLALLDQQEGILTTALKYHVVDGVYGTGDIVDGLEVTTLQGETLTLSLSNDTASGFTVNGLEILSSDILANNGVVHVIEGVLVPQELTDTDESEVIVPDSVSNATDPESSEEPDAEDTSTNTIVDVAVSTDDLSNLVSLVVEADPSILEALSSPGNYTVFAPNNAAIQALFDEFGVDAVALGALDASTGILSKVLTYHVVEGVYDSSDIVDGIELTTLQGEDLTLNLSDDSATGFVVNDVEIIATDILADNGIVHVINGVLVPKELAAEEEASTEISDTDTESATIVEIASGDADFSTLVSLILLADESIASLLSSPGNFTVLAPTNEAFEQLLSTIDIDVDDLVTLEEKAGFLSKVLSYHVVDGSYESSEIVDGLELITLQGEKITFTLSDDSPTGVAVNGANVVAADILASNGVIHAIDGVLIAPPISGGPGTSVATNDTETDLTSALQAFYGNGLPLILGSLLASISDVSN